MAQDSDGYLAESKSFWILTPEKNPLKFFGTEVDYFFVSGQSVSAFPNRVWEELICASAWSRG